MVARRFVLAIIICILTVFAATSAWGAVLYVKQNFPGPVFDGTSWDRAFHTVQEAVDAAQMGDEVWVAAGTYVENVSVAKSLYLYGGFQGMEAAKEDRDWLRFPTVLDGNKAGSVVDCSGITSYPVRIDGFTIVNGHSSQYGGGICMRASSFGAVPTGLLVVHCILSGNSSGISGGAVYAGQPTEITDCVIRKNTALYGGAIQAQQIIDMTNCTVSDNVAVTGGGGLRCWQGGFIKNCTFENNTAADGGAMSVGISDFERYRIDIDSCKFSGNSAVGFTNEYTTIPARGGAVYVHSNGDPIDPTLGSDVTIHNSFFSGNAAADAGSAVYLENCGAVIEFNSLAQNGLAGEGAVCLEQCVTQFLDNIVAFNTSGVKWNGGTLNYERNCFHQNAAYDLSGDSATDQDNIFADPKFANPLTGNLHIQPDSPCVNAGVPCDAIPPYYPPIMSDIDGHTRCIGGTTDIGADESNGLVWDENQVGVVYVSPDGDDEKNDGSSWEKAKRTIQAGIDAATSRVAEVWVAAGSYNERVTLRPGAWLYGGFAGDETDKSQRDWKINNTVIDGTPAEGEEGGSVVTAVGIAANLSCLDGFTVRGGAGTPRSFTSDPVINYTCGGGIYCESSALKILNCTITSNKCDIGGGMYCVRSSALVNRCTFTDNDVLKLPQDDRYGNGGALYCEGASTITGNVFSRNIASRGSAIYCSGETKISFNTIVRNGGFYDDAVCCKDEMPVISSNIIAFNPIGIWSESTSGFLMVKDNCVYGNFRYDYAAAPLADPVYNSDIHVDPRFVSLDYGDFHIQPGSPCVDKGDDQLLGAVAVDIDGQPRVVGEHADIGAYECDGVLREFQPIIVRVDGVDGSDDHDGSSWLAAKKTIHAAVNALRQTGGDVWVKAGTYYTAGSADGPLSIPSYVHVYGGFDGGETQRSQRDWVANVTKIAGQAARNPLPEGSLVKFEDNCAGSVIDGFTITQGNTAGEGGGVYCGRGSSPTICNNTIVENAALSYPSCGGGIFAADDSRPSILSNIIARNSAYSGAGIYVRSAAVIVGNTIADNIGEGVFCHETLLQNNIIAYNQGSGLSRFPGEPASGYNCIYYNGGFNYTNPNDITVDPMFRDRSNGDYHLTAYSPCIDAGVNTISSLYDIDGEDRVFFDTMDIGADENTSLPESVAALKLLQPGTRVRFAGTVTYTAADTFCVESPNRSSAIAVSFAGHSVTVDDEVNVIGVIRSGSSKVIDAESVVIKGKSHIEPLLMSNRSLGGSDLGWDPATGLGQPGVTGGIGPNNIDLLVRTTGRVTSSGTGSFWIDDGSGLKYGTPTGIEVIATGLPIPAVGSYVSVTGVVGTVLNATGRHPMIWTRTADDIVVLQQ